MVASVGTKASRRFKRGPVKYKLLKYTSKIANNINTRGYEFSAASFLLAFLYLLISGRRGCCKPTEADRALVPPYVTSLGNYENSGSPCTLQFILAMTLASHRMISTTLFFLLLCSSTLTFASDTSSWRRVTASSSSRNVPPQGYYNPADKGGSMLDVCSFLCFLLSLSVNSFVSTQQVPDTIPPGQGEPLNVIISGASDPAVLLSSQVGGGLLNYYLYMMVFFCCS